MGKSFRLFFTLIPLTLKRMTYFHILKKRPITFSLVAVTCAFSLMSACSHKQSGDSADQAPAETAPAAGTDAVPAQGADGKPAAANGAPADPNAPATAAAGSTDGTPPSDKPKGKGKKVAHHRTKHPSPSMPQDTQQTADASTQTPAPETNTMSAPPQDTQANAQAIAQANAQATAQANAAAAQQRATQQNAAANVAKNNPEDTAQTRAPASPRNSPNHANADSSATGEITGEGGGGLMDTFMAYRSAVYALCGLVLVGGGGFAFWKKKQLAA